MLISLQGSDKLIGGTFSGENGGLIKSFGNIMISQKSYITYDKNKGEFDAYEVARRIDKVPINVVCKVGGKTYSNFDTNRYIMYAYTPDNVNDVPTLAMNSTGRVQKGSQNTTSKLLDFDDIKSKVVILDSNDNNDLTRYMGPRKDYTGIIVSGQDLKEVHFPQQPLIPLIPNTKKNTGTDKILQNTKDNWFGENSYININH